MTRLGVRLRKGGQTMINSRKGAKLKWAVNRLLDVNEQLTFNLFGLIEESAEPFVNISDGLIVAQSSDETPIWARLPKDAPSAVRKNAVQVISERMALCPEVHLNISPDDELANEIGGILGKKPEVVMPMRAMACRDPIIPQVQGKIILPNDSHEKLIASLLTELCEDGVGQKISPLIAADFAGRAVQSGELYVWADRGQVVSMAMVAHRAGRQARINTVVTFRERRGHGYACALVATMSRTLLCSGFIPMLYADARNPASNRAYEKAGFKAVGEITEYRFV